MTIKNSIMGIDEIKQSISDCQNQLKKLKEIADPFTLDQIKDIYKLTFDVEYKLFGLQEKYQSLQQSHAVQDVQMDVLNMSEKLSDENEIAE